ncbi:MAG: EamA family transporter [Microbacteriaceae bacterium]|jgi:probable blue pigment (indigoidine) exporter|nr:EamA family transporter [Microbacteriaceae bacterium]
MEATVRWGLVTAIAPVAWGTTYFVTRHFLPADYPLYGAFLRAFPAGLLLLLIGRSLPRGSWWWKAAVLGALNFGSFFVLVYVAAQLLPSSLAATLMATSPVVMLILAWPLLRERPQWLSLLGAAVGVGGVCIMLFSGGAGISPLGVAASVAAMLSSSVGFILTKRWGPNVGIVSLTAWQLIAGSMLILPIAVLTEGALPPLDRTEVAGFTYVTVVATAIAFAAWFAGLRHLRAGSVALIGLLNPVTGVALGAVAGGEPLGPKQIFGAALVIGGIVIGQPGMLRAATLAGIRKRRHPTLAGGSAIGGPSVLDGDPRP